MADSKITALAALTTADPANDMFPVVDVSDTSMAASGTTKRISINNILACSPSATLASATITGDLTVDTSTLKVDSANNRVGIGTASPTSDLDIFRASGSGITSGISLRTAAGAGGDGSFIKWLSAGTNEKVAQIDGVLNGTDVGYLSFQCGNGADAMAEQYRIASSGLFTWYDGAGGTRMTLNSTGLGVGMSPANDKLLVSQTIGLVTSTTADVNFRNIGNTTIQRIRYNDSTGTLTLGSAIAGVSYPVELGGNPSIRAVTIDNSSNVGIGVTPSAWRSAAKALQVGGVGCFWSSASTTGSVSLGRNIYEDSAGNFTYIANSAALLYEQSSTGIHSWYSAAASTGVISFGSAKMTLDASGNLLCGTTTNTNSSRVFIRNGIAANPSLALQGITGDVNQAGLIVGKFDNNSTTSQILVRFTINDNAGGSGQINANGASQAAFGSYSDSRLKENILCLPSQLANILSLRPVEFDYKDGSGHQIGFVAQEMQEVYSDAVGEQNGFLTVTGWSKTEARLVSAIKELAAKVQALEAKLA